MEGEERLEIRLAALVEAAQVEREGVRQYQEDEDEHISQRRREVTRELAAHDDAHVVHGVSSAQAVMVRNTSSSRPDSRCSSLSLRPCRAASSDTAGRMVAPARGSAVRRASRSLTSRAATAGNAATAARAAVSCPGSSSCIDT